MQRDCVDSCFCRADRTDRCDRSDRSGGAIGPTGPPGATGPTGVTGARGTLQTVRVVTSTFTITGGLFTEVVTGTGSTTCPANSVLITGGWSIATATGGPPVTDDPFVATVDQPTTPGKGGTWTATLSDAIAGSLLPFTNTVTVYAICSP